MYMKNPNCSPIAVFQIKYSTWLFFRFVPTLLMLDCTNWLDHVNLAQLPYSKIVAWDRLSEWFVPKHTDPRLQE